MKTMIASCGLELREDENFVCPYCLGRGRPGYSNCGVNVQFGTNVCMDSLDWDTIIADMENNIEEVESK